MLCRRTEVFPVECVVRGYISGSAWKEYKESGTLAGEALPEHGWWSEVGENDRVVSQRMRGYWTNFAKTGDPNGAGLPAWPPHDPSKDLIFEFRSDSTAGAIPDIRKARLDVMELATESEKRVD